MPLSRQNDALLFHWRQSGSAILPVEEWPTIRELKAWPVRSIRPFDLFPQTRLPIEDYVDWRRRHTPRVREHQEALAVGCGLVNEAA
jgi:hypothetical protein